MKTAREIKNTSDTASQTTARIDTQDESFAVPLGEFLITHGCAVIVNGPITGNPDYHLAVGERDFVKRIFETEKTSHTRRMGIVWGGDGGVSNIPSNAIDAKIALVTPTPLSSRLVTDIFQFFFTDASPTRDFRPEGHEVRQGTVASKGPNLNDAILVEKEVEKPPGTPGFFVDDRQRIARLIQDLFSQSVHEKKLKRQGEYENFIRRLIIVCVILASPIVWYWGAVGAAGFAQAQILWSISDRNTDRAGRWFHIAEPLTGLAKRTHAIYAAPFYWIGAYMQAKPYEEVRDVLSGTIAVEESLLTSIDQAHLLGKSILSPQESSLNTPGAATSLSKLKNELTYLVGQLGLVQANLDALAAEGQAPFSWVKSYWRSASGKSARAREDASALFQALDVYGALGGFKTKQTYLFLFQNSMELRPTGGFIGSIGIATFAEGKLSDFTVQDVYTVDGQLKGHVSPPEAMSALLGSEHWYLRDSNWDPDFRESAKRASWFYEKETGTPIDGVVGVSVPLLVELLRATGPIALVDFNDTITAENFFGKSLYHTQANFFPGSTQKKDFLGALARAILTRLESVDNAAGVARAMLTALGNRTLMIYSGDSETQHMVEQYGWSGRVPEHRPCGGLSPEIGDCVGGFLSIVEANLSVNKTNYFLKRAITHHIALDPEGRVRETAFVEYTNNSTDNTAEGGGTYTSYVRFIVSPGSTVERIQVDGDDVPMRQTGTGLVIPPYQDPPESQTDYVAVPVAISVPPGVTSRISVSLVRQEQFGNSVMPMIFQHVVQKQPGTSDDPLRVSITYPLHWALDKQTLGVPRSVAAVISGGKKSSTPVGDFLAKEGRVEYNTTLSTDRTATFLFLR